MRDSHWEIRNRIAESALSHHDKHVLRVLIDHLPHMFPGISRLVRLTSICRSVVILSLKNLERLQILVVTRATGKTNGYALTADWAERLPSNPSATRTSSPHEPVRDTEWGSSSHGLVPVRDTDPKGKEKGKVFTTPKPSAKKSSARKLAATALPSDWQPSEAHREFSESKGLDLPLEVTKFRGHAEANDRRAKVWNGAFSSWLANAATYAAERRGRQRGPAVQRGMAAGVELGTADYLEAGA